MSRLTWQSVKILKIHYKMGDNINSVAKMAVEDVNRNTSMLMDYELSLDIKVDKHKYKINK